MDIIRVSIHRPIAIIAAVLMIVMFGVVALNTIPIQLTPDVRTPVITINTTWNGAAPAEIEREIVNRQEEAMKGLEGIRQITSRSRHGRGEVKVEFGPGGDMDKALLLVANRLDRVSGYPDEVVNPTLKTSGTEDQAIAWFVIRRGPGNERPIDTYGDFVQDVIQDRLERVVGVSRINVYGGSDSELKVIVNPERMALYGLTVPQVVTSLRNANVSVTAGDVEEGKRRYIVRVDGELTTVEDVENVVIRADAVANAGRLARVTVGDIAEVRFGYKKVTAARRFLGEPTIPINAVREAGANVIKTMADIHTAIDELNNGALKQENLSIKQVYDETIYIKSAINLVIQNIYVGGALAAIILMLFLRSIGATMVVSLGIPVSVIGAFVGMSVLGRSLNVISLAGIAFSVGMVVDAAIVVLENIYRLRQEGRPIHEAAYLGAKQVWGAILVSALTTVMVFIPILTLEVEVGQLFRDIAVAISVSVTLSLIVAVTVIPALACKFLKGADGTEITAHPIPILDRPAHWFVEHVTSVTRRMTQQRAFAGAIAGGVVVVALIATWALLPKLEYLPEGNRNLVLGILVPPPGYNLETTTEISRTIEGMARPYWKTVKEKNGMTKANDDTPTIDNFFFVARQASVFVGASAEGPSRAEELIPLLAPAMFTEPGTFGRVFQPSLFGRSLGSGRSIDVNIMGGNLEHVMDLAVKATGLITKEFPRKDNHQFRPKPGLELGAPEIRIHPDPLRLEDAGVSAKAFSQTVDAFNDGLRVAEITVDGKRLDLTLTGPISHVTSTQGIESLPIVTGSGQILPVHSLATVEVTAGPTEILHVERERTVTLQLTPSKTMPLETAMEILQTRVIDKLEAEGLPEGTKILMSGTADKLTQAWDAMVWQILLALVIVYLVMAVLFESFLYPLIIMVTVPVASAGAVGGLAFLNLFTFQALDMLTMLGFVILIGIVVNNAILVVHQTLHHQKDEDMEFADALVEAIRNRIRPIFMSTLTSLFGMLPLVVFPGAGSELYRGLGAVVLGGLALSALLTLLIVPSLMSLTSGLSRK